MQLSRLQNLIVKTLEDAQAEDIVVLNVRRLTPVTERMIICTGRSLRHLHAIAEHVVTVAKKHKQHPRSLEGHISTEWILVDLSTIVVHIMTAKTRKIYDLEKLWQSES